MHLHDLLDTFSAKSMFHSGQAGQMPPQGGYGVVPPPNNYAGSLPIPALGQQPLSQGGTPTGPYTALLGSQMQPLLPPGVLPGQYPPPNFAGMPGVNAHLGQQLPQQQPAAVPPKKRQRESRRGRLPFACMCRERTDLSFLSQLEDCDGSGAR